MFISMMFISSYPAQFAGFGKRAVFDLSDPKPEGWEKIGSIRLENCRRILEENRI